jgi:2C-methyl-D-erythritol 2,4-cyclodiphosphate synthase
MESLTSVVKLEDENKTMKESISQLLSLKEDGILVKFNLEKRLKEQMARVDQIQEMEKQA